MIFSYLVLISNFLFLMLNYYDGASSFFVVLHCTYADVLILTAIVLNFAVWFLIPHEVGSLLVLTI